MTQAPTCSSAFVWYELMTSDVQAAETFYKTVVGWHARDAGMPDMRYTLVSAAEAAPPVGGMLAIDPAAKAAGAQPSWVGYVSVDDVDAATARVTEAGGNTYFGPADIPGVGRFAMLADPQGVSLALFHGESEAPPAAPAGTLGHVGWHELHALDGVSAFAFYAEQFGWQPEQALDMGSLGMYQMFAFEDVPVGGMMTKMAETARPQWLFYFNVDNIQAAAERVKAAGGQVVMGPRAVPGGSWILNGLDPQGALFALVAPAAAP